MWLNKGTTMNFKSYGSGSNGCKDVVKDGKMEFPFYFDNVVNIVINGMT